MQINVEPLARSEASHASEMLSRAFAEDPIITHYLSNSGLPAFFRAVLEQMFPVGHVYAARCDGNLVGVAAWMPPDPPDLDPAEQEAAKSYKQVVETMFPQEARQLFAGFAALEQFHPSEPHWYLAFVGIEPSIQSRGFGRALLAPVLKIADDSKTCCYLETPFPRKHAFYERLGFKRQREHSPFDGAPQGVITFLRKPDSLILE